MWRRMPLSPKRRANWPPLLPPVLSAPQKLTRKQTVRSPVAPVNRQHTGTVPGSRQTSTLLFQRTAALTLVWPASKRSMSPPLGSWRAASVQASWAAKRPQWQRTKQWRVVGSDQESTEGPSSWQVIWRKETSLAQSQKSPKTAS